MKYMNIVVSIVVAAAVLVAAYGVGLLVRHARMHDKQSGPSAIAAADDPAAVKAMMDKQRPGGQAGHATDPNLTAKLKAEREKMLEKMKNMTEEEKHRFIEEQVRSHVGGTSGRGRFRELSPEERDKIMRKWQTMSEEEKKAFEAQTGMSPEAGNSPQTPSEVSGTTTQQKPDQSSGQSPGPSSEPGGSEPGKADQG
jgi:hypothetical protein